MSLSNTNYFLAMITFNVLLALPDSVVCMILQDWLNLKFLVALDSALCKKSERRELLSLLRSNEFLLEKVNISVAFDNVNKLSRMLSWIVGRQIPSQYFAIVRNRFLEDQAISQYIATSGSSICSLALHDPISVYALLESIITHCHHLTFLHVCTEISDKILRRLLIANSNLVEVNIDHSIIRTDKSHSPLENVRLLNLRVLSYNFTTNASSADVLQMGNLIKLEVSMNKTTDDLLAIARFCPTLRSLDLRDADINDTTVSEIARSCRQIVNLDLEHTDITNEGIHAVVTYLRLHSLNIMFCYKLTHDSLEHIYTYCADTLHTLYTDASIRRSGFEYNSLDNVLKYCTNLHTLCWGNYGQVCCGNHGQVPYLTTLILYGNAVCDRNLLHISQSFKQLVTLTIVNNKIELSVRALTAVVTACAALRYLHYSGNVLNNEGQRTTLATQVPLWKAINPHLTIQTQPFPWLSVHFNVLDMPV